jgi:HlyD family secretion protein
LKRKWIFGIVALLVIAALIAVNLSRKKADVKVNVVEIGREDLTAIVSASGTIQPQRSVNVSANAMGTITKLAVSEGDRVAEGDFLLEIDPTEYASTVTALEAAVNSAAADLRLAEASLEKARLDFDRARDLFDQGVSSDEEFQTARTASRVEEARVAASRHRLQQQRANLDKARHDLAEVTITAPMAGIVTRLNVEEGESAIMGTLNIPGTVLLTIADLGTMEAWVEVDETEVVNVEIDQLAEVEIDAFPDSTYHGRVTEIGNSPLLSATGAGQEAVDFEVKITLDRAPATIRPGLSAKASITVSERWEVLAVPLGAVTVRSWPLRSADIERYSGGRGRQQEEALVPLGFVPADSLTSEDGEERDRDQKEIDRKDTEGVFIVRDDFAKFVPVTLGIAGEDHFEVLDGLEEGATVIAGPFRVLRDLKDGTWVEIDDETDGDGTR